MVGLREAAAQAGATVGWDPNGGVTINGNPVNTTGLTNYGGKAPAGYSPNTYYGTQEQIDSLMSPYVFKGTYDTQKEGAFDAYNQWAGSKPNIPYEQELEDLVKTILSRTFQYDSANDAQFQSAAKELTRNVMESMNARGILNSTVTENQVQQGVGDLIPQYEQIARQNFQDEGQVLMSQVDMLSGLNNTAYNRFQDEGTRLAGALDAVMKMSDDQYQKWSDAYTNRYQAQRDKIADDAAKIEAQRQKVKDAWEDTSQRGTVSNQSGLILDVKPGTLSKDAREAKIKRDQELEDQETSVKNQKEMADYQYNLSQKLAAQKDITTAAPETLGNTTQVQQYNALKDIYFGGGSGKYAGNPLEAYNWLISHSKDNTALMGQKLYNKLLAELIDSMNVQKAYGTNSATTSTVDDYSAVISKAFVTSNGEGEVPTVDYQGIADYLNSMLDNNVDQKIVDDLAARWKISIQ
jgi:hypothetical protein